MEATPRVLFVDDESPLRALMAQRLAERGFEVAEADSGERALELLDQFAFDVVITDLRMPGIDGTRVFEAARERYPGIVAIVITAYGTVKDAVDAIKRGASDFIAKPFQFDELMHVLQKSMEQQRLKSENAYLRSQLEERYQFGGLADLPPEVQAAPEPSTTPFVDFPDSGIDMPAYLAAIERDLIQRSLVRTHGNRNKAAELLHIKRTTLVEKLRRLGTE